MADYILITGDQAIFQPTFGPAIVTVLPGILIGSGPATVNYVPMCLQGDEAKVIVPGCPYISGSFSIPGVGMLMIDSLAPDQLTMKTTYQNKPIMLKGSNFIAKFQVLVPAIMMAGPVPVPDPVPIYMGQGSFMNTNMQHKAT